MAKCINCNSCLKYINLFGKQYLYCLLCSTVYKVQDSKLIKVEDQNLIKEARRITGNAIV